MNAKHEKINISNLWAKHHMGAWYFAASMPFILIKSSATNDFMLSILASLHYTRQF